MPDRTDWQLANGAFARHQWTEAKNKYLAHAAANPADAAKCLVRAAECDPTEAPLLLSKALEADAQHVPALLGLAHLLPESATERLSLLERAAENGSTYLGLLDLGDFYRSVNNDYDRAYAAYKKAHEKDPKDRSVYLKLADLAKRMGLNNEAESWRAQWKQVSARRYRHRVPAASGST